VPLLEGVLTANNSLRVKQNALYVLALSDLPRAHEILMSYAKGGGNPDLQLQAISYLASRRDKQTTSADLRAIYEATDDTSVRLAIISAYRAAGDKVSLVSIASNGSAPVAIRSRALSNLSNLAAPQELWSLYQKEASADLRMQMLSAFNSMKSVEHLTMAAKTEKDPPVRRRAIRYLGGQAPEATGQTLIDLYSADLDVETRKSIIEALSQQTNAEALVAIARKDSSPEVLRDVVVRLSAMAKTSPAAASFLAEIIKR
jgi:HEAT repeat protein